MQAREMLKRFRQIQNRWIPRQRKGEGGKGPNATEAKYLRDVLNLRYGTDDYEITYQPKPIIITNTGKREYTADFLVKTKSIAIRHEAPTYHEVKGSYHLPTHERARLAWEIAAERHPEAAFVWAELTRKGWEIERWERGGAMVFVHYAGTPPGRWSMTTPDWRRHKPRKTSTRAFFKKLKKEFAK